MVVESSLRPADSTGARPSKKAAAAAAAAAARSSSSSPPLERQQQRPPKIDSGIRNPPCPLFDIIQYACQPHFNYSPTTGERIPGGTVTCYPIPRIFRKCPGMPAIDVSERIFSNDGVLPLDEPLPKGQSWAQVKPKRTDPFKLNE